MTQVLWRAHLSMQWIPLVEALALKWLYPSHLEAFASLTSVSQLKKSEKEAPKGYLFLFLFYFLFLQ